MAYGTRSYCLVSCPVVWCVLFCADACRDGRGGNLCNCSVAKFAGKRSPQFDGGGGRQLVVSLWIDDTDKVFTRSSKRPALARVFWIHLLEVCLTFAGSCKHPMSDNRSALQNTTSCKLNFFVYSSYAVVSVLWTSYRVQNIDTNVILRLYEEAYMKHTWSTLTPLPRPLNSSILLSSRLHRFRVSRCLCSLARESRLTLLSVESAPSKSVQYPIHEAHLEQR